MTPTTIPNLLGGTIRDLREARGWSQDALASQLRATGLTGWTRNQVAKAETGRLRADRSLLDLAALCAAFQISLTELLAGDEPIITEGDQTVRAVDVRMALVGLAEPTDPTMVLVEEYNLDRIVLRLDLDTQGELRMITRLLYGRDSFLEVRDERAGIAIRPGSRSNIAKRRGYATKTLIAEIAQAIQDEGKDGLLEQAMDTLRATATEIEHDNPAKDTK